MKKSVKIKSSSLPSRSLVGATILFWLLLEYIKAQEWAYGALWTIAAILAVAFAVSVFTESRRDVPDFGDDLP